MEPLEV